MRVIWPCLVTVFLLVSCSSTPQKSMDEQKAELYYSQGTTHLVSGQYTQALDYLLKAEALTKNDTRIQNNLGMAYYFKGRSDLALEHLNKAIDIDSKNSDAKNNMASIYFHMGRLDESEKIYKNILEDLIYPYQHRTYYGLGLIEQKRGNPDKAKELFERSIKENSDYCVAHMELGKMAFKAQLYQSALERYKDAGKGTCYTANPDAFSMQAYILSLMGQNDKAIQVLADIIKRFPRSSQAKWAETQKEKLGRPTGNAAPSNTRKNKKITPVETPIF